ncbi:hypothetical protein J1N35_036025 [Gossypium stocksii]|uniref:FHA domain-containing protein n=1 Tax=Gossypium stocksii TaxID=47602 RepID=A0A9D3UV48_9ROSI|nr:hypothetical protein J1N35_036025 [Gossypium stocksii]
MEGYLMEITHTLMNDEPFFLDVDIKDVIDKSFFDGLSSLLASSPNNSYQDQMIETITIETQDSGLGESYEVAGYKTMAVSLTGHEKSDNPLFAHVKDSEDLPCVVAVAPEGDSFVSNGSSNSHNSCLQVNPSAIKQEVDALRTIVDHPPPEAEELLIESDEDVLYFSDVEAMVLIPDMDLDPDDQDLCDWEVARYQHEDSKRATIRLEQGPNSYMQRAIASNGAFAILYDRHSNHYYIKKPEILLGRTKENFIVDTNLRRQGYANNVSRQQAIINMEEDGSFHLKKLGKCLISINNEVDPGHSPSLNSGCLIQIRGISLIFETNQTCVKQYLNSVAEKRVSFFHGEVKDAFIPIKKSKVGTRFGFVSSEKDRSVREKRDTSESSKDDRLKNRIFLETKGNQARVVQGFVEEELLQKLQRCLVGESATVCDTRSMADRLTKFGLREVSIKRIQGRFFLIEVSDEEYMKVLKQNDWVYLKECFITIEPWSEKRFVSERVTWIDVVGENRQSLRGASSPIASDEGGVGSEGRSVEVAEARFSIVEEFFHLSQNRRKKKSLNKRIRSMREIQDGILSTKEKQKRDRKEEIKKGKVTTMCEDSTTNLSLSDSDTNN